LPDQGGRKRGSSERGTNRWRRAELERKGAESDTNCEQADVVLEEEQDISSTECIAEYKLNVYILKSA
jgi:hypothetical protein